MEKMETTDKTLNNRVNKFIKRFFNFFHLPNFVPKKWYKKLKKIIYDYFSFSDSLEELQALKDDEIADFNIVELIATIDSQNSWLDEFLLKIKASQNTEKANADSFTSMLDDILTNQDSYNWYTELSYDVITGKKV